MALEQLLPERIVRRAPTMSVNANYKAFLNSTVVEEMLPPNAESLCLFYDTDTGALMIEPVARPGADAWPIRRLGKGITLPLVVLVRRHSRHDIAGQRFPVTKQDDGCLAVDLSDGEPYAPPKRGKE